MSRWIHLLSPSVPLFLSLIPVLPCLSHTQTNDRSVGASWALLEALQSECGREAVLTLAHTHTDTPGPAQAGSVLSSGSDGLVLSSGPWFPSCDSRPFT